MSGQIKEENAFKASYVFWVYSLVYILLSGLL